MEKLEFAPVGSCPACLSSDSIRVEVARAYGHRLEYRACSHCGLVRLDPRPTDAAIGRFYETFYMGGDRNIESSRVKQRDFAYFMLSVVASHVRLDRTRSVLDLGCGYGETLAVLAKAITNYTDVSLHGIEPSDDARKLASQVCEVVGRSDADLAASDRKYDLIVMSHVLEHMTDPVATLKLLRSKLTAEGAIALEVPNYFCHPSADIVHNFLFTPESLRNVFAVAGLDVAALHGTDHSSTAKPAYLTAVVKPGAVGGIVPLSAEKVLASRRAAVRKWPGYTQPAGARQLAKRLLGMSQLG